MSTTNATLSSDSRWTSPPDRLYLVHNRTPRPIVLSSDEGTRLHLSPLGQRVMCRNLLDPFWDELWALRRRHHVSVRPYVRPQSTSLFTQVMMTVGIVMMLGALGIGLLVRTRLQILAAAGIVGLILVVRALYVSARTERARVNEEREADIAEGDVDYGTGSAFYSGNDLGRIASRYGVLFVVVVFGVLLPAIAIIVATDAKTFFEYEDKFLRVATGKESQMVARSIQLIYVAILTVFPALMFFQFDRHRAGTIRGQWVRSIFRIDGRMENLSDVNARYGNLMSEASNFRSDASRALGGKHSPLIIATILIGLGWVILVARTESFNFDATTQATAQTTVAETAAKRAKVFAEEAASTSDVELARAAAAGAVQASQTARMAAFESEGVDGETPPAAVPSGIEGMDLAAAQEAASLAAAEAEVAATAAGGTETEAASTGSFQLLTPDPGPAGMAFLGAYFFAVYLVLKAYLRGDLRPKVYNQIIARLVTVVVIAYLISVLIPVDDPSIINSLAFLAGVVPNTVLRRLGELTPGRPLISSMFGQAFGEDRPLTLIDGVDVYERERLATEGISDIEALAHTDIVANMVNTRIPMERLIDWVDQSVLILHLDVDSKQKKADSTNEEKPTSPEIQLREHGIRTASAFISAIRSDSCEELQQRVRHIIGVEDLEPMASTLERELVMRHIEQWYASPLGKLEEPPDAIAVGSSPPEIEIRLEPSQPVIAPVA